MHNANPMFADFTYNLSYCHKILFDANLAVAVLLLNCFSRLLMRILSVKATNLVVEQRELFLSGSMEVMNS